MRVSPGNYTFNCSGELVDENGDVFKFTTQEEYERLCDEVTEQVYERLTAPPYSLRKVNLSGEESISQSDSFVFISPNFATAHSLVVLIHGSGAVRAGQWSRRLIINESLEVGSQLPYVRNCLEKGWAVLVMNTNDNKYADGHGEEAPKMGSPNAIEHGLNVWNNLVIGQSPAKDVAIVAHSFGGVVTMNILRHLHENRIRVICLTDAMFDPEILDRDNLRHLSVRNWVCSSKPLDEPLNNDEGGISCSAGTMEHERSSAMAMSSVFRLIKEAFGKDGDG